MKFEEKLVLQRKRQGLSQEELARIAARSSRDP